MIFAIIFTLTLTIAGLFSLMTLAIVLCVSSGKGSKQDAEQGKGRKRSLFRGSKRGELFHHPIFVSQRQNLGVAVDESPVKSSQNNQRRSKPAEKAVSIDTSESKNGVIKKKEKSENKSPLEEKKKCNSMPDTRLSEKPQVAMTKCITSTVIAAGSSDNTTVKATACSNNYTEEHQMIRNKDRVDVTSQIATLPARPAAAPQSVNIALIDNNAYGSNDHTYIRASSSNNTAEWQAMMRKHVSLPVGGVSTERNPSYLHLSQNSDTGSEGGDLEYSYVSCKSKNSTWPVANCGTSDAAQNNQFTPQQIPESIGVYVDIDLAPSPSVGPAVTNHGSLAYATSGPDTEENPYI